MEIIPLLPSLKEDSKVAISKRGQWMSNQQNTLPGLTDSLKISTNSRSTINSIPDVWARPVLFQKILFKENHPLHKKYVAQWRGLLAIMALYKYRGYDTPKLYSIEIPEIDKIDEKETPGFLQVLAKSIPDSFLDYEKDKTLDNKMGIQAKIQTVTLKERPLGIIWPEILIAPAVDLEMADRRISDIAWWHYDGLNDPIESLSDDERAMLYTWIKNIRLEGKFKKDELINLLTTFENDIVKKLTKNIEDYPKDMLARSNGIGITGTSHVIDGPIEPYINQDTFLKTSHIRLKRSSKRNFDYSNKKEYLIISRDIESLWNQSPNEIMLGGTKTIASILRNYTSFSMGVTKLDDIDLDKIGAEVRAAETFLTDAIAIVDLDINAFPNSLYDMRLKYQGSNFNVIPPVKKELLDYLDPKDIERYLEISVEGDKIKVELSLPVSGMDNRERYIIARKIYSDDPTNEEGFIIRYNDVPLLQVWPNFRLQNKARWKKYYTYYDAVSQDTFYAEPVWNEEGVRKIKQNRISSEVRRGNEFPIAFACYEPKEDNYGVRYYEKFFKNYQDRLELGIILLDLPAEITVPDVGNKVSIGIDFGTTNTVAYQSTDDGEDATLIKLPNRMYYVCNNVQSEYNMKNHITAGMKDNLRMNFLSPEDQPASFALNKSGKIKEISSIKTIFHQHIGDGLAEQLQTPLFRGNIYYFDNYKNIDSDKEIYKSSMHTVDLKWDSTSNEIKISFLTQLIMQCLAEAVYSGATDVTLHYSYPQSFTEKEKSKNAAAWRRNILTECKNVTGINIDVDRAVTESVCFAQYFVRDMNASPNSGIVCLDIGGGSTDIVIWQGKEGAIKYQTSLRIAGGTILGDYLYEKLKQNRCPIAELKTEGKNDYNMAIDGILKESQNKNIFILRLDTLLKYFDEDINDALMINSSNDEVSLMVRDISFALCGILFYTGYIIGYLRKTDQYTEKKILPKCYFGGNASKLLHWVSDGAFYSDALVCKLFDICFKKGITMVDAEQEVGKFGEFKLTQKPKQEVAYGLVVKSNLSTEKAAEDSVYISAEEYFVEDTGERNKDLVKASDFIKHIQIDSEVPPIFKEFVEAFNKESKTLGFERILFDDRDYADICSAVNQELREIAINADGDEDEVKAEPIFIIVLKHALKYLAISKNS